MKTAADAREAMMHVGRAIRDQYVIGYQAPDSGQSGKWHRVSVKAKTNEGVDAIGRGEAIAAQAIAVLRQR